MKIEKIGKKDLIQISGIGILLLFLILPSHWFSQLLLYTTPIYSFFGSFYIYLFPLCFLLLGIIQGLLWQSEKTGSLPFAIWIMIFAMLSCLLIHQWFSPLFYQIGFYLSGLVIFLGILLIHGLLVWIGLKLTYYDDGRCENKRD